MPPTKSDDWMNSDILDLESVESRIMDSFGSLAAPLAWMHVLAYARFARVAHAAARLRIADALACGPRTAAELAAQTGADVIALTRLLRALAATGVLERCADGRFSLTEIGSLLRSDTPMSFRHSLIEFFEPSMVPMSGLVDTVMSGRPAFEAAHGEAFFDYMARDRARGAAFDAQMSAGAALRSRALLEAVDLSRAALVVDIGGGEGALLCEVLRSYPSARGVLFDSAATAQRARERLAESGLGDRSEVRTGDFFDSAPEGGDAYVLSFVLHDWDDARSARILTNVCHAMREDATVHVVELVRAEEGAPSMVEYLNLDILELLAGRERTEGELCSLLEASGLRPTRVARTSTPFSVIEARLATR